MSQSGGVGDEGGLWPNPTQKKKKGNIINERATSHNKVMALMPARQMRSQVNHVALMGPLSNHATGMSTSVGDVALL